MRQDTEIFVVSAFILYLELVLIRWVGTEIRVFAYLGNLILVVCFFGVGWGCYRAQLPVSLTRMSASLLVLVGLVANPFHVDWLDLGRVTDWLSGFEDSLLWAEMTGWKIDHAVLGLAIVALLMYLVASSFVPAGQVLGIVLQKHPRTIRAYSFNIAGSLAGVWLFDALSWISMPPVVWFAVAVVLVALLGIIAEQRDWMAVGLVGTSALLAWLGSGRSSATIWSPYHKLTLTPFFAEKGSNRVQQGYMMDVNGTFYQHILNLSDGFLQAHPEVFDTNMVKFGNYNLPFCFKRSIQRMLIVGAGTGNDAAAALRHGVEQIDCVEIDPKIYELGRELHPERPYDSARVRMFVNDARAFFKQASGQYDAIWFGWLDSHTLGSTYNNLRLDNYVYTLEGLREAKHLLADDGVLFVGFAAERPWIAYRLFALLSEVFGREPLAFTVLGVPRKYGGGGNLALVASRKLLKLDQVADQSLREFLVANQIQLPAATRLTTDDWPYLYLERAKIPKLHWLTSLAILGTVALVGRREFGLKGGLDWHFFALGAAFLMLEVQTVSRATLLFGMTWVVNAIVISAVLVMILLANLVAARWPQFPQWLVVVGLAATVAALALVPLDWFNALTGASKLVAASAFLTAPVFFAGLIFIRSFAASADKPRALACNLIGSLVGGLLESLSFMMGLRALVILVGLFYAIALRLRPRIAQNLQATCQ